MVLHTSMKQDYFKRWKTFLKERCVELQNEARKMHLYKRHFIVDSFNLIHISMQQLPIVQSSDV